MKPLYLIVHKHIINPNDRVNNQKEIEELKRIKKEEDFISTRNPTASAVEKILQHVPKNRPIKVCGAYGEICVWEVWNGLVQEGYQANIYWPASIKTP